MAQLLSNENDRRMDEDDLRAVIAAVEELGFSAEVDRSQRVEASRPTAWWVLYLHWMGDETLHTAVGAALAVLARRVTRRFPSREQVPPDRIYLFGPDGLTVLRRVDVPENHDDTPRTTGSSSAPDAVSHQAPERHAPGRGGRG